MSNIEILSVGIRQDVQGRFSLNDLHRASGGEDRHSPRRWLDLQSTADLITALGEDVKKDGIPSIVSKQGLGTFASIELVYDYAAWISPTFKLEVYRTFHAVKAGAVRTPVRLDTAAKDGMAAFRFYKIIGLDKNAAAIAANQAVERTTGVNLLALGGQTHLESESQKHWFTPTDLGRELGGLSGQAVNRMLESAGLQDNRQKKWTPTPEGAPFSRVFDVSKGHNPQGTPTTQLKWSMDVLDLLRQ